MQANASKKARICVYFTNTMATRVLIYHLSRKATIPAGWLKGSTQHSDPSDGSKGKWLMHLDPHKVEHVIVPKLKDPSAAPGKNNPWEASFSLGSASNAPKTFFRVVALDASGQVVAAITVPPSKKNVVFG